MTFSQRFNDKIFELEERKSNRDDLHLIAATLMFAVINADGHTGQLEVAHMIDILRSRHALSIDEISVLLASAKKATVDDLGIETLANTLCEKWGDSERAQLLNDFWGLATADREIKIDERLIIELIANNLCLEADEITRARYNAEQRLELKIR